MDIGQNSYMDIGQNSYMDIGQNSYMDYKSIFLYEVHAKISIWG